MTSAIMMERAGMGMSSMPVSNPSGMMGGAGDDAERHECRDGSALHDDVQEVRGRDESHLRVRRQGLGNDASKPLQHDAGGLCSCCCMMNGMMVCCCNLTMAMCKCEPTDDGVCLTCTSGDPSCCAMIEACCACMTSMMKAGCTCCLMINNMPVCCGC